MTAILTILIKLSRCLVIRKVVYEMLDHPLIAVQLGVRADRTLAERYDHTFYSGPLDAWFNYSLGRLRLPDTRFCNRDTGWRCPKAVR